MKGLFTMTLFTNSKITNAINDYDLRETICTDPISFSDRFEKKMERLIRRKQRHRKCVVVIQRLTLAVSLSVLIGAWLFTMLLQRGEDGMTPHSGIATTEGTSGIITAPAESEDITAETYDLDDPINDPQAQGTPPQPTGTLIIYNDEPIMGIDAGLRSGITGWEEAREAVAFEIREPTALPSGSELLFIELSERGENGSYPCAAALFLMPMGEGEDGETGAWHLYLHQYYLGSEGTVVLAGEEEGTSTLHMGPGNTRNEYRVETSQSATVSLGGTDILIYTLHYINTKGESSSFHVLHWIEDNILFRITAPIGHVDFMESFHFDDLLRMAESLIA